MRSRRQSLRIGERRINRATVVGFGMTGQAVARFLVAKGSKPRITDSGRISASGRRFIEEHQLTFEEGRHTQEGLGNPDLIVLSPGVDPTMRLIADAKASGVIVLSEIDLAFQLGPPVPTAAVTGTNGKSTTVRMIQAVLQKAGRRAIVAGNIGTPYISVLDNLNASDTLILEASSYQLEQSTIFHPQVAMLLNISPDHLERHKTIESYQEAKMTIFSRQSAADTAILPSELGSLGESIRARKVFYDSIDLSSLSYADKLAPHNRDNLKAAIAACSCLVRDLDYAHTALVDIEEALCLPFRLQEEGEIDGVRLINDSKSTNPDSAIAALRSFDESIVLILGGRQKAGSYARLAETVAAMEIRKTIAYGEAARFLSSSLQQVGYMRTGSAEHLSAAFDAAVRSAKTGDVIIFSPACASYDQYSDFVERGKEFSRLVRSHPSFSAVERG